MHFHCNPMLPSATAISHVSPVPFPLPHLFQRFVVTVDLAGLLIELLPISNTLTKSMLVHLLSHISDGSSCRWPSLQLHLWQRLLTGSQKLEWNCWRDMQFLHKFKAASSTCTWPMKSTTSHKQWTYDNITFGHVKLCDMHGIKADVCTP